MTTILGTTDEVSTCDCCGRSDLKRTVEIMIDGEVVHYGTTCAALNLGVRQADVTAAIRQASDAAIERQAAEMRAASARLHERQVAHLMSVAVDLGVSIEPVYSIGSRVATAIGLMTQSQALAATGFIR